MNSPLISVVMCTYNGSRFLDEQVYSILGQDYPNLELLIVDDHSTDDTWDKLKNWERKNDRIHIYKNDINIGYNKNFVKAISLASGDFIAISDQDDVWMPTKISKLISTFDDPNVVLAHNRSVRLENGRLRTKSASLNAHFKGNDTRKLFMFNQVNGHDMVFRKQLVDKFTPIPDRMMYDWWIAVIATCFGKIASVNEFLVHHRIHEKNSFFSINPEVRKKDLDLEEVLVLFTHIEALNVESKKFLLNFLKVLSAHNKREKTSFDYSLFKFLLRHRRIIFNHKTRTFQELAYLRFAFRYAKVDFRGKGITF